MVPCRLVIVDAHALLYRVHYSFGLAARLKTRGGQDTSIEYGFINTVSVSVKMHGGATTASDCRHASCSATLRTAARAILHAVGKLQSSSHCRSFGSQGWFTELRGTHIEQ